MFVPGNASRNILLRIFIMFSLAFVLMFVVSSAKETPWEGYNDIANGVVMDARQCDGIITYTLGPSLTQFDKDWVRDGLLFWELQAQRRLFFEVQQGAMVVFQNTPVLGYSRAVALTSMTLQSSNRCAINCTVSFIDPLISFQPNVFIYIVRHEIGHVLGFLDSKNPKHIMYYAISSGANPYVLSDEEFRALNTLY